jgi:hypothetical protein
MEWKELQLLMNLINSTYVFNEESYPQLKHATSTNQRLLFVVNHSLLHMQKSLGVIATQCEKYDHQGVNEIENEKHHLELATVKMLINTLKLAEELGMTGEQLSQRVVAFYAK